MFANAVIYYRKISDPLRKSVKEFAGAWIEWPFHVHLHRLHMATTPVSPRFALSRSAYSWSGLQFPFDGQLEGAAVLVSYRLLLRSTRALLDYLFVTERPQMLYWKTPSDEQRIPTKLDVAHAETEPADSARMTTYEGEKSLRMILESSFGDFSRLMAYMNSTCWKRVAAHVVATIVVYPFLVTATTYALRKGDASVFHLSTSELYAGLLPRVGAIVVQYSVFSLALYHAAKISKNLATLARLWHIPRIGWPWLTAVLKVIGVSSLWLAADYFARPLNLISSRARTGMISAVSVATISGCATQLSSIVRSEGFWALWRGSGFLFSWRFGLRVPLVLLLGAGSTYFFVTSDAALLSDD